MSRRALQPRTGGMSGRHASRMAPGGRLKSESEIVPTWYRGAVLGPPPVTINPNGAASAHGRWGADFGPPPWHTYTFNVSGLGSLTGANLVFAVCTCRLSGIYFPAQWRNLVNSSTGSASHYAIATIDSFDGNAADIAWSWTVPTSGSFFEAAWVLFAFRGAVGSWTGEITNKSPGSPAVVFPDPGLGFRQQWHFGTGWYASTWNGPGPPGIGYVSAGGWSNLGSNTPVIGSGWITPAATEARFVNQTSTVGTYYHDTIGAYGEIDNTTCVTRFGGTITGEYPIDIPPPTPTAPFTWGDYPAGYTWGDHPAGLTWGELDSIDDLEIP